MNKITAISGIALSLLTAFNLGAQGTVTAGRVKLLSHEVTGSYVQLVNASNEAISTNPDNCGIAGTYFLPLEHPNYSVLSSSLVTAQAIEQKLTLEVNGCENNQAKIAFIRFGDWNGANLATPVDYPASNSNSGIGGTGKNIYLYGADGTTKLGPVVKFISENEWLYFDETENTGVKRLVNDGAVGVSAEPVTLFYLSSDCSGTVYSTDNYGVNAKITNPYLGTTVYQTIAPLSNRPVRSVRWDYSADQCSLFSVNINSYPISATSDIVDTATPCGQGKCILKEE